MRIFMAICCAFLTVSPLLAQGDRMEAARIYRLPRFERAVRCIKFFSAIGTPGDNVAHMAHLGGMLFGFFMIRYWNNHPGSDSYGRSKGREFFNNLKRNFARRRGMRSSD